MDREIFGDVIRRAKKAGADQADILAVESKNISVATRLAKLEKIVQADVIDVKMRLFIGKRSAVVTTDNLDELKGMSFIEKAIFAAKNSPEDEIEIRPNSDELCKSFKEMDIFDAREISSEKLVSDALKCEKIALQIEGITNSGGVEASYSCSKVMLIKNNDFLAEYQKTLNQISIITLAARDGFLERAYDFSEKVYYSDLKSPEQVAKKSAERTLRKLGAKKIQSCKVPVVFDRMVSSQLLESFMEAINGASIAKGISFLGDKLFKKVFNRGLNIADRYAISRGLRSRPFDSDGLECMNLFIVKDGVLNSFLLNTKYANKLGMKSTGNAYGFEGIAPNNVCIENGKKSFADLLKSVKKGLYVTEVLGNGLNLVTGNYSQGAVGFWIENGEITYPVSEITIAGNFLDMFSCCEVASDLEIESGIDAPTLLVDGVVIGGI
ncbi:MAG: TldD/PmbA family protein [Holosporaceae bacterium]|jgi:PmbA protein|nr:TldD/PmbA family protein [Holosporaceae bacterium]